MFPVNFFTPMNVIGCRKQFSSSSSTWLSRKSPIVDGSKPFGYAEHPSPAVEGIEHPPNTIRAPKGTFNEHTLIPKKPEILNEIVQAAAIKS